MRLPDQRGFTVIEMLVTIGVIGLLLAISLPAIQASRESSRRTECQNHLHQLATAMLAHESATGRFPTAGWDGFWVWDPDRGTGRAQPGGWVGCLLPYLERRDLAQIGAGQPPAVKQVELAKLLGTSIAIFNCPSRRSAQAWPITLQWALHPVNTDPVTSCTRSDYAANAGDQQRCEIVFSGPATLAAGDDPRYPWPDTSDHTGICFMRSEIGFRSILDGKSYTYLIGEKYVSSQNYETGDDHGDDWSMYTGYQDDICRTAFNPPLRDHDYLGGNYGFGSAHPEGWNVAFCDGSVRPISYRIDVFVHGRLANRKDLQTVEDKDF